MHYCLENKANKKKANKNFFNVERSGWGAVPPSYTPSTLPFANSQGQCLGAPSRFCRFLLPSG